MLLSHADSLNESPKLYNQRSMLASSLSCSSESRSSSSEDNLTIHSPVHQLDTGSPDNFEYLRMFEDASVIDMLGPSFSGANYRSESCQGYEMFEDLNMNLLKIDLLDDISSRRQSLIERGPSAHGDVLNESLMSKDESDITVSSRTRSPSSQRDSSELPLIPAEELEVASELKKENYSGQQSPAGEQWPDNLNMEDDASIAMSTKEETAKKTEEDHSLDSLRSLMSPYQCNEHPCTQLFYCQTCCKPICKECSTGCIYKHVTIDFAEFIDNAQHQAEEVLIEAYLGIDVLADDMENMGVSNQLSRSIDAKVIFYNRPSNVTCNLHSCNVLLNNVIVIYTYVI